MRRSCARQISANVAAPEVLLSVHATDRNPPIAAMSASAKRTPQSRPEADIKRLREPSHRHNARRHCLQGPLRALPDRAFGMSAQHARGRSVRLEKVDDARGLKFA